MQNPVAQCRETATGISDAIGIQNCPQHTMLIVGFSDDFAHWINDATEPGTGSVFATDRIAGN
jgi:hypothetical protein